jgi:hypothetical protein
MANHGITEMIARHEDALQAEWKWHPELGSTGKEKRTCWERSILFVCPHFVNERPCSNRTASPIGVPALLDP